MSTSTYRPFDYVRVCDWCGRRRNISAMTRHAGAVYVCDYHPKVRTTIELDRANAAARPWRVLPVPNAKPLDLYGPDIFDAEETVTQNFVIRMMAAGCRYLNVTSGDGANVSGSLIPTLGWGCRYLYGMIAQGRRSTRATLAARTALAAAAVTIQAHQVGFGLSPTATRATNAFYGAILEPSALSYLSEDAATCGLALLYAYRETGTVSFLFGARAAASYLRNVQAIGKNGTHFTSSDSAGNARLYTGAVASLVSTSAGMYSDSRFYPSGLLALEFWKALEATDGDQSLGATAVITGFDSVPAQLLSTSVTDMRAFWATGTPDAGTTTPITGLSSTTPREAFNAYPASKPNTLIVGTGKWEYADGGAATGTEITGGNFAKALCVLYGYEGASAQVTAVDDWLRGFVSNAAFETPANTSPYTLARDTTGTYDPTQTLATLLIVRDSAHAYAATAKNGSKLYDWGAFGLLSALWSARHGASFAASRRTPTGITQRYNDGRPSDGEYIDRVMLRARSGLSGQTSFADAFLFETVTVSLQYNDAVGAAQAGICFRQNPLPQSLPAGVPNG